MTTNTKNLQLPKSQHLDGESNYSNWASQIRRIFEANNLEDYVNSTIAEIIKPKPTNRDEATNKTYKE